MSAMIVSSNCGILYPIGCNDVDSAILYTFSGINDTRILGFTPNRVFWHGSHSRQKGILVITSLCNEPLMLKNPCRCGMG